MIKYIMKRMLQLVIVLLGVIFLTFIITQATPSDAAEMKYVSMGMMPSVELLEQTREEMGLNDPVLVQYGRWLVNVLHGDLGTSTKFSESVWLQMTKKLPMTLKLAAVSGIVMVLISFPLGVLAAIKKNKVADYLIRFFSFFGISIPKTLTIKTSEPNAALLNNICEPVFDIVDTTQSEDSIKTAPVCTGPYVVSSFTSEQSVELEKNENYWDGEAGLDTISVTQIADSDARAMAIQSGETDITNTIDNKSVTMFADESKYHVSSIISPRVNVAYMNNAETSPLSDIELRKAVSYAVDRDSYAGLIGGSAAHSAYSDATPFGNEKVNAFTYDTAKAEEILDAAGYIDKDGDDFRDMPDGSELKLRYLQAADHGSSDSAILATAVQSDLKKVGINMEILAVENLSDYQTKGDFDFYTGNDNSAPTGDPQVWLETMYTGLGTSGKKNLTGFKDDKIDEIVTKFKSTFDTDARYELATEASQILNNDAANLFLTNSYINMVSAAKIKNAVQPVADFYFITKDITVEE